jgi:hypothetical protein
MQSTVVSAARGVIFFVAICAALCAAHAQSVFSEDERIQRWVEAQFVVQKLVDDLSTGKLDRAYLQRNGMGPDLLDSLYRRTGGTFKVPELARLGEVMRVALMDEAAMPHGSVYSLTATHERGESNWQIGLSSEMANKSYKVLYVEFKVGGTAFPRISSASRPVQPSAGSAGTPPPVPAPPADISAACRKYPTLC